VDEGRRPYPTSLADWRCERSSRDSVMIWIESHIGAVGTGTGMTNPTGTPQAETPENMTAAVLIGHGGPENLVIRHDAPTPVPGDGEVLVRVGACGVNNTDINTRTGWYGTDRSSVGGVAWNGVPVSLPRIQGADVVGVVVATKSAEDDRLIGRRVLVDPWLRDNVSAEGALSPEYLGSERDGGFAQFVAVPAANAYPIESGFSDIELATFPCSASTAEHMLQRASLREGETVIVTGASGGVGTFLIQLARMRGARVIALASTDRVADVVALGADMVFAREHVDDWRDLLPLIGGPVEVVADVVGGAGGFRSALGVLQRRGRYVTAGAIGGAEVELDLRTLYLKDLTLSGCSFYDAALFERLVRIIEDEQVKPVVSHVFALAQIHEAQALLPRRARAGSIVLTPA